MKKIVNLIDVHRLINALKARHNYIFTREHAKEAMSEITNQMEKNDISISIMHWKKSFYIKLESQKRYGYSGVYNWILGENMIPINSEYAEKYTKAMRKRDSADNKVRLIDKFLCSGMAIKYVFMQE